MIYDCEAYLPLTGNPYLYGEPFGGKELMSLEEAAGVRAALTIPQGYDGSNNRTLREAMDKNPGILGCCYVEPSKGKAAVEESRMTVREWGFKGLKLLLGASDIVDELVKNADDLGIPVTIHTNGDASIYPRIAEMAKKYPRLPIIMEHMGYRYHADLAIGIARHYPNLHLGTTVVAVAEPMAVKRAIDALGVEKVLFGSNAPWALPKTGVEGIRRLNLGTEDEKLVLGGNFQRIFHPER